MIQETAQKERERTVEILRKIPKPQLQIMMKICGLDFNRSTTVKAMAQSVGEALEKND